MRYYKVIKDGELQYIGTGLLGGEEITKEEYEALADEIKSIDWTSFISMDEETK